MELKTCKAELAKRDADLLEANKSRDKFSSDLSQVRSMMQSERQGHYTQSSSYLQV